ncbi:hypothetical protein R5R35_010993 [Gryllus longicercus]|uniref:Ion transport domain-containing protein n=1 Tax=Gryllus longicercus TaxID=2509291 RepID=A0AAN9UZ89_9ORTH
MILNLLCTWFERISMLVILLNCVTLGMYRPCMDEPCNNPRCKILEVFDELIFAFFTIEMAVKMTAMGAWGKGTYLADPWNRLDAFIVLAGALEYGLNLQNLNLSAIRTIRVLRPLRAINRIPSECPTRSFCASTLCCAALPSRMGAAAARARD